MKEQYIEIHKNDFKRISLFYDKYKNDLENNSLSKQEKALLKKPTNLLLEITILGIIQNRLRSSMNNIKFKNESGRPYVIFTYDEMIKVLHCTARSCTKVLNDLENHGFISMQRTFNGPTKYYVKNHDYKKSGYYRLYYKYFSEFNNNLKYIYAYMIIKDLEDVSRYKTLSKNNKYNFIDENGKYFVEMNTLDLSNILKCSLPTGGKIINYLEKNGYIKRNRMKNNTSRIYVINYLD
ncbi:hypothetical protein ACYATM_06695 [Lactobacillaceae bacterium Scapto_B20]